MKKVISILLSITLIFGSLNLSCIRSYADERDFEYLRNLDVIADGKDPINVKYVDLNYDNASYVSLRDMAVALKGTHAEYSLTVNESSVTLTKGGSYTEVGGENEEFTSLVRNKKSPEYTRKRNRFTQNGAAVYYYTIIYKGDDEKNYDCYMYLADLALVLNVDMHYENGALVIDTSKPFTFDPRRLEDEGYFLSTNSVLVGDATTGEIYYSYNPDASVAMASTTKLMTFLLVMDEISKGNLSLDDTVETSANVEKLSNSIDRTFRIPEGTKANIDDLIYGMLLPSSNECTLALAEAVSGSEKSFVKKMNEKAATLGLSEGTEFHTCNGLPVYTEEVMENKVQNFITANDMFKLVCHIFSVYPQITDYTSCTTKTLSSLGKSVNNTNPMLYNVPGVVGLKTGTTNKAGACLVSALQADTGSGVHTVVVVELGAEDILIRNNVSQALLVYGSQVCKNGGAASIPDYNPADYYEPEVDESLAALSGRTPETADELARLVVWTARNYMPIPEPDLTEVPDTEVNE